MKSVMTSEGVIDTIDNSFLIIKDIEGIIHYSMQGTNVMNARVKHSLVVSKTDWESKDTLLQWADTSNDVEIIYDTRLTMYQPKMRNAVEIADTALAHIKQRAAQYDSEETGERSAEATATAFNAITGHSIKPCEVFLLLQILKDVRQWKTPNKAHSDSLEDCIAYASLKAEQFEHDNP